MPSKKPKTKQSRPKPAVRPPSPEPIPQPPPPAESSPLDALEDDLIGLQAPSPEPELDPEPFLIEPEPEPAYPSVGAPHPPAARGASSPRFDHLAPPSPPVSSLMHQSRHRRPHSLPNPRLSPPPDLDADAQTALGGNPHIVACISCDQCALLTNKRDYNRSKLGLNPSSTDSFIPVVCSSCEDDRALYWCRMASANSPPSHRTQYPGTISSRMLASWFVFTEMRARFGVSLDDRDAPYKRVTRARDWWREGVLSESDPVRLSFWQPVQGSAAAAAPGAHRQEMEAVDNMRRDLFFGQFVHPTQTV